MNSVNIIGRIGNEVELKKTTAGKSVVKLNIAVRRKEDKTDWINCVCFGVVADIVFGHFKKGNKIGITGQLYTEEYEVKGEKRTATKVFVNEVTFIEPSGQKSSDSVKIPEPTKEPTKSNFASQNLKDINIEISDDDLPF